MEEEAAGMRFDSLVRTKTISVMIDRQELMSLTSRLISSVSDMVNLKSNGAIVMIGV